MKFNWRVLGDCVCLARTERRALIPSKQPNCSVGIKTDDVATRTRRVDRLNLDIAERTKDMGFDKVHDAGGTVSVRRVARVDAKFN